MIAAVLFGLLASFPVTVRVDAEKPLGDLVPIWRFFGCGEPNYAYLPDGARLLATLGSLGEPQVYFRTHNLLTSGEKSESPLMMTKVSTWPLV